MQRLKVIWLPEVIGTLPGAGSARPVFAATSLQSPQTPTPPRLPTHSPTKAPPAVRTLITETQLAEGVSRLAREIDAHYQGRPITVVAVLTGSVVLFADLIRRLSMPQRVGVIRASSYRGGTQPGELVIDSRMLIDVKGREVLLVDDIFDTGATIAKLRDELQAMGAADVATAVLLRKTRDDQHALRPDFVAFDIPDEFVVGYGLDYLDMYRNLPYIAVLEPAEIAATAAEHG